MLGTTPEGMGHHILLSVKMTLNLSFSVFLYHYIDSSVFLEVARRGGLQPPSPLNPPLSIIHII